MKIIDGQIHIWLPNTPDRPWPQGAVSLHGEAYTAEKAIAQMDAADVKAAALVPPSWMGSDNSYSLEAAAKYRGRFAVMGRYDWQAADAPGQLDRWRDNPAMTGMRLTLIRPDSRPLFQDSAYEWFWSRCEEINLPLMCYMPRGVALLEPIARRHPALRIVVDHAGRDAGGPKDEAAWHDMSELLALAKAPNVAVKVSSLPSFSTQPFPFPNLHPHIKAIHDAFGAQRMIWGSDVTRLTCPYGENIRLFSEALGFLSDDDKEWIFGRSLAKWCDIRL
jgi:predicted TIM-barrel fold metal-dependent hydrolase